MSEIPEHIMERAREIANRMPIVDSIVDACAYGVAYAIMDAEKRGKEEERERCFAEADKYTYASGVAKRIAAAIRGS